VGGWVDWWMGGLVDGWMGRSKSRFKDCLAVLRIAYSNQKIIIIIISKIKKLYLLKCSNYSQIF
jgi:hypothetical protein